MLIPNWVNLGISWVVISQNSTDQEDFNWRSNEEHARLRKKHQPSAPKCQEMVTSTGRVAKS